MPEATIASAISKHSCNVAISISCNCCARAADDTGAADGAGAESNAGTESDARAESDAGTESDAGAGSDAGAQVNSICRSMVAFHFALVSGCRSHAANP